MVSMTKIPLHSLGTLTRERWLWEQLRVACFPPGFDELLGKGFTGPGAPAQAARWATLGNFFLTTHNILMLSLGPYRIVLMALSINIILSGSRWVSRRENSPQSLLSLCLVVTEVDQ